MNYSIVFLISFLMIFVLTILGLKCLIPYLMSKKVGQKILDIGPRWHKNKEGTPTMGGISFIAAGIIAFSIFAIIGFKYIERKSYIFGLNIFIFAILNGLVGLIDDIAKMKKAKNEGLTAKVKFLLQSVVAILFLVSMKFTIGIDTNLYIPFFNIDLDIGFFYYIISYFAICGVVNSVNLTDGIDGLASSIVFTVGCFFAVINIIHYSDLNIAFFSALLIASSLGFLTYNFHPAKIFMGDTGSLYLGALVVAMSFLINNILLVLVYGFVFICEALSDILQVVYFKISKGKRLFKMAPLHHHFEKKGWNEIKIVIVFTIINAIFCVIAYFGLKLV